MAPPIEVFREAFDANDQLEQAVQEAISAILMMTALD
jgi:hypothetical protein